MSVLIDKQGIVRWIDRQINPTTHGMDVVAKVKELEKLDSE
jgi:peroxiredoxin